MRWALLICLGLAGCSDSGPKSLGEKAALTERAYFVFGKNADAHAATFMKAWADACSLAKGDMASDTYKEFIDAYVDGLQSEPGAAAQKPLQKYVREHWWKSGAGCQSAMSETPEWVLK